MHVSLIFIIFFLLVACTPQHIPPPTSAPKSSVPTYPIATNQGDTPIMTPIPLTPSNSGLQILIEKAKVDLAQRLSISLSQINLVEATDVIWPDSSLGCPQKDMVYADVLTPGFLIILSADNRDYEYHTSKGTEVVHCKNPTPPVPGLSGDI